MTTPTGDNAFLRELELNVRSELTIVETVQPEAGTASEPTLESLLEVDDQRYEVGLHALLGAVEILENGSRPGDDPHPTAPPR
jgi:hypothetical protein